MGERREKVLVCVYVSLFALKYIRACVIGVREYLLYECGVDSMPTRIRSWETSWRICGRAGACTQLVSPGQIVR